MTSIVQNGSHTNFSGSDSLMLQMVVPHEREIEVEAGQDVTLDIEVKARMDHNDPRFSITT